jgi:hypothetical protein
MADNQDIKQNIDISFSTNAEQEAKKVDKVVESQGKVVEKQKQVKKETTETSKATGELSKTLDGLTGGAVKGFQDMLGGIKTAAGGFRTLAGAIAMTGIGALVIAVVALASAFTSSEEGQNKFAKIMAVIGSVIGNVMDVISDLGEIIIGVLSGDSKAIKSATDFGKKIFDVVGLPIKNIIDTVKTAGKVLGSLFSGDVKGAFDNLKQGVQDIKGNFVEAGGAIVDAKNALKGFAEEAAREAQQAMKIADMRANADKLERGLIVEKAEAERKRAELLEKAQQRDKFSQAERVKFLKEAGKLDEEITNKQIQAAKLKAEAIKQENTLSKSNKEALKAEEEAKAEVIRLETERLKRAKEVTGQIQGLQEQELSEAKRIASEKKAILDKQKAEQEAFLKQIKDLENTYLKGIEDLNDKSENQKLERQKQRDLEAIENLRKQGADVAELLRLNAEKYAILEKELAEKQEQERKDLEQKRIDDRRAFDEQYYNGIREFQDAQNAQEIEAVRAHKEALLEIEKETALRKIEIEGGTPEEIAEKTAQLNEYYRQRELDNNKAADDAMLAQKQAITDQLMALEAQGFATAKMLFEKNKGVQKGILIAENAIALARVGQNTAAGISKAMAKGLPTGPVEAGIIGASGALSAINIIAATAKGLKALGGGSAGDSGVKSNVPRGGQEPQVGFQNSSENQIANTINRSQEEMPPIQTYVVSQEVTNNQQIDRNRQASNSF